MVGIRPSRRAGRHTSDPSIRARILAVPLLCAMLVPGALLACAGNTATPAPSATPSAPAAVAGQTLGPNATTWPLSVIDAVIQLAALDNEIKKAGADLIVGAQKQDPSLMLSAAKGLSALARESMPNAERLSTYPPTQKVGTDELAALSGIQSSSDGLAAALESGNAAGVTTGAQDLSRAIEQYRIARVGLVDLADLALSMRHMLVK